MAWTLIPGVKQDHRGRFFQIAVNSRGRQDLVYVQPSPDTPLARTIPVREPPAPKEKPLVTTGVDTKRPVIHRPVRKCVCEFRYKTGQSINTVKRDIFANFEHALSNLHNQCDFHVFYHVEEKVT